MVGEFPRYESVGLCDQCGLQKKISGKVATGVDRLEGIVKREQEEYEIAKIHKTLLAWLKRVQMMIQSGGKQIEHIL